VNLIFGDLEVGEAGFGLIRLKSAAGDLRKSFRGQDLIPPSAMDSIDDAADFFEIPLKDLEEVLR
jgi:hypothetical protein